MTRLTDQERLWRSVPEKDLQETFRQLAEVYGWLYYHDQDSRRNPAGLPDTVLVVPPTVYLLELKRETAWLRDEQRRWASELLECDRVEFGIVRPSTIAGVIERIVEARGR